MLRIVRLQIHAAAARDVELDAKAFLQRVEHGEFHTVVRGQSGDRHFADAGRYPATLDELVTKRDLRAIPSDPITQSSTTWVIVAPDDAGKGGIYDVRSGAKGSSLNGKPYAEW